MTLGATFKGSIASRVATAHAARPDLPAIVLARELGCATRTVRSAALQRGIRLPRLRQAKAPAPVEFKRIGYAGQERDE